MKRTCAIGKHMMSLAACAAASRLVCRRRPQKAGWRAVCLFWRRTPKQPGYLRVTTARLFSTIWAPQVHIHFSVRPNEKTQRFTALAKALPRTTQPIQQHFVLNRFRANTRVFAAAHYQRVYRAANTVYRCKQLVSAASTLAGATPRPAAFSSQAPFLHQVRPLEELRHNRLISQTEKTFATKTFASTTIRLHHHTQNLQFRSNEAGGDHAGFRSRPQVRPIAAPELVWRRAQQAAATVVEVQKDSAISTKAPTVLRPRGTPQPAATEGPISHKQMQGHPSSLDPAFLDRLTDDVINRLERRVRIDRERRGI